MGADAEDEDLIRFMRLGDCGARAVKGRGSVPTHAPGLRPPASSAAVRCRLVLGDHTCPVRRGKRAANPCARR
jgi:hypothetical protein